MARNLQHAAQQNLGDVVYNDVHFPPAINSSVQMEPVYDRSERGLMYVKYSIRIEFIIHLQDIDVAIDSTKQSTMGDSWQSNNPTRNSGQVAQANQYTHTSGQPTTATSGATVKGGLDHAMAYLRRRLLQPGRELLISGLGLGPDLNINQLPATGNNRELRDVAWGPKPRNLTWEPIGGNSAARVVWDCEVGLVECEDIISWQKERFPFGFGPNPTASGQTLPVEILQVVYNESWDISQEGLTTKTYDAIIQIRGYVDTSANRARLTNVITSADQYRLFFEPKLQEGFKRSRRYKLNDDKTQLEIQIIDEEINSDWAYPPGVTQMKCDYSIESKLTSGGTLDSGAAFHNWKASLSGSMTMAKGTHPIYRKYYPYYIMLSLIRSRYFHTGFNTKKIGAQGTLSSAFNGTLGNPTLLSGKNVQNVPLTFQMTEDIFGREFSFSFSWLSVWVPPQMAPAMLRFGYNPALYMEEQNARTTALSKSQDRRMKWDWSDWLTSMIGWAGYTNQDNKNYSSKYYTYYMKVEGSQPGQTRMIPILRSWGEQGAPMSMRGAAWAKWEGDTRMEPCQNNNAFWFNTSDNQYRSAPYDDAGTNLFQNSSHNTFNRIVEFDVTTQLSEDTQVISVAPLNNPETPVKLTDNVDGKSTHRTAYGNKPVNNTLQTGQAITEGSGLGDAEFVFNPVIQNHSATSANAAKVQCIGPAKHKLTVTGRIVTAGKPIHPPRVAEWGTAIAVRTRNITGVRQVESGQSELWETSFTQEYALLGTPNGQPAKDGTLSPVLANGHTTLPSTAS